MSTLLTTTNSNLYVNGQLVNGQPGPALFSLVANEGEPTITPNTVVNTSSATASAQTEESYYTAFLTFKLTSLPTAQASFGFKSVNFINTFAFSFDIVGTALFTSSNGSGAVDTGQTVSAGDILTIALTSYQCKFFLNGVPIVQVGTNTSYLNVSAHFYSTNDFNVSNIAFGYLCDPIVG